ncbi:unnamed protein product [Gadus morhua 'NCC']
MRRRRLACGPPHASHATPALAVVLTPLSPSITITTRRRDHSLTQGPGASPGHRPPHPLKVGLTTHAVHC